MPSRKPNNPQAKDDLNSGHIVVGRIRGGWGVSGDVKVEILSDAPSRFSSGGVVYLNGKTVTVERARKSKGIMVVKLDSIADRTAADELKGQLLTVPEVDAEPLPDGVFYHFQMIDLPVHTVEGEDLGRIVEIIETGANDVYVIRKEDRRDILIPALVEVVLSVDLDGEGMIVQLPEGLVLGTA